MGRDLKMWTLKNEYHFEQPWNVYHFQDKNPTRLLKVLESALLRGEKCLLLLAAQKERSRFSTHNLEQYFRKAIEGLRTLRIDARTSQNPEHEAFNCTNNLDEIIVNYDLVLASPTIQTGISIEAEYFDGVYAIFQGVQSTDVCRQFLSRYRPPVPRYIWMKTVGFNFQGSGSTSYKSLLSAEKMQDYAHIKRLCELGLETTSDNKLNAVCLKTWAKMAAIINLGMRNYSQEIIQELQQEGHTIISVEAVDESAEMVDTDAVDLTSQMKRILEVTSTDTDILKDDLKSIKKSEYTQYCLSTCGAPSLSDKEYEELKKRAQKTTAEQFMVEKGRLERLYHIPVTPQLVEKDDAHWYSKIKLDYYLCVGQPYLDFRDLEAFTRHIQNGEGHYFSVDTNNATWGLKVAIARALKIQQLKQVQEISNQHPLAMEIFSLVFQKNPKTGRADNLIAIKNFLGISLAKAKTPIAVCQALLELIDYKLPCLRREGTGKNRLRIYGQPAPSFMINPDTKKLLLTTDGKAIPIYDQRQEVFEAWLKLDQHALSKYQGALTGSCAGSSFSLEEASVQSSPEEMSKPEVQLNETSSLSSNSRIADQMEMLATFLPGCDSPQMVAELTAGISMNTIVHALRILEGEVCGRVLNFCHELRSAFSGALCLGT
jgi:hypothetical protein